jgi:hypothetical protein
MRPALRRTSAVSMFRVKPEPSRNQPASLHHRRPTYKTYRSLSHPPLLSILFAVSLTICSLASSQSPLSPRPCCLLQSQSQSQSPHQVPRLHLSSSNDRTWGASSTLSVRHTARYPEYLALTSAYPLVSDGVGIWNNVTSGAGDVATFVTSASK